MGILAVGKECVMSDVDDGQPLQIVSSSSRHRPPSTEVVRRADNCEAVPALVQKVRREREERERKERERERNKNLEPQWSRPYTAVGQVGRRAAEIYQQQRAQQASKWVENQMAWEQYESFQRHLAESGKNYLWNQYQQTQMDNAYRQAEREQGHY
jgi:hypothetical protein